jgi:hypothetical protein
VIEKLISQGGQRRTIWKAGNDSQEESHSNKGGGKTDRENNTTTHYSRGQGKSGRRSHSHGDDDGHNQKVHHHNK